VASRGWENVSIHAIRQRVATPHTEAANALAPALPSTSKYRNVRTKIGDDWFDSKKEADYFLALRAREQAGEIQHLRRQVIFPLLCPRDDRALMVSSYVADFTFEQEGRLHIVDAKGVQTQLFRLKAKWLQLQTDLEIELV
jgi:Protein of unknown function (DUF1064)